MCYEHGSSVNSEDNNDFSRFIGCICSNIYQTNISFTDSGESLLDTIDLLLINKDNTPSLDCEGSVAFLTFDTVNDKREVDKLQFVSYYTHNGFYGGNAIIHKLSI